MVHQALQCGVHHAVALDRQHAGKGRADDAHVEVALAGVGVAGVPVPLVEHFQLNRRQRVGQAPADLLDHRLAHGKVWRNAGDLTHLAEDVAYLSHDGRRLLATGESGDVRGTSLSTDGGRTWTRVGTTGYHTLDCTHDGSCWAAGGSGRVARLAH